MKGFSQVWRSGYVLRLEPVGEHGIAVVARREARFVAKPGEECFHVVVATIVANGLYAVGRFLYQQFCDLGHSEMSVDVGVERVVVLSASEQRVQPQLTDASYEREVFDGQVLAHVEPVACDGFFDQDAQLLTVFLLLF